MPHQQAYVFGMVMKRNQIPVEKEQNQKATEAKSLFFLRWDYSKQRSGLGQTLWGKQILLCNWQWQTHPAEWQTIKSSVRCNMRPQLRHLQLQTQRQSDEEIHSRLPDVISIWPLYWSAHIYGTTEYQNNSTAGNAYLRILTTAQAEFEFRQPHMHKTIYGHSDRTCGSGQPGLPFLQVSRSVWGFYFCGFRVSFRHSNVMFK